MKKSDGMRSTILTIIIATAILLPANAAYAYVGPGLGAGTLAVAVGLIGSVILAIFAIVWYPIKRILKRRRTNAEAKDPKAHKRPAQ
jgi:hypothetical protein